MSGDFDYTALTCPMPDCKEELWLVSELGRGLYVGDLSDELPAVEDAHSQSWKVECIAGHVVLLPTEVVGCGCPPEIDCEHDGSDDYDWHEETRRFRARDRRRLVGLLWGPTGMPTSWMKGAQQ